VPRPPGRRSPPADRADLGRTHTDPKADGLIYCPPHRPQEQSERRARGVV